MPKFIIRDCWTITTLRYHAIYTRQMHTGIYTSTLTTIILTAHTHTHIKFVESLHMHQMSLKTQGWHQISTCNVPVKMKPSLTMHNHCTGNNIEQIYSPQLAQPLVSVLVEP